MVIKLVANREMGVGDMDLSKLSTDWLKVSCQWNCPPDIAKDIFLELCERYQHKSRFYHTLTHVESMLILAESYRSLIEKADVMFFAIWFHDAVQSIGKDNEKESAELASRALEQFGAPEAIIERVCSMILTTKKHIELTDSDTQLFIDFDLAILGSDRDTYQKYTKNCRKEYAIPNWIYNRGRIKFLESLLERPSIFQSEFFQNRYEKIAIDNIQQELKDYTGDSKVSCYGS